MRAPVSILHGVPIADIAALFASLPRLTAEEAAAFSRDIEIARPKTSDERLMDSRPSCLKTPADRQDR